MTSWLPQARMGCTQPLTPLRRVTATATLLCCLTLAGAAEADPNSTATTSNDQPTYVTDSGSSTLELLGCFPIPTASDLLQGVQSYRALGVLRPKLCWSGCAHLGYTFAGISESNCFCVVPRPPPSDGSAKCTAKCAPWQQGDTRYCGGRGTMHLYEVTSTNVPESDEAPVDDIPPAPKYPYVGCWVETRDSILPFNLKYGMDVPDCLDACKAKGYSFGGVKLNSQCACGNDTRYSRHGASKQPCTCKTQPDHHCGGRWDASVYLLHDGKPPTGGKPATPAPPGMNMSYLHATSEGCVVEGASIVDWEHPEFHFYGWIGADWPMQHNRQCFAKCAEEGFPQAGVNHRDQCYCGDVKRAHVAPRNCSAVCSILQCTGHPVDIFSVSFVVPVKVASGTVSLTLVAEASTGDDHELSPLLAILLILCTLAMIGTAACLGRTCRKWGEEERSSESVDFEAPRADGCKGNPLNLSPGIETPSCSSCCSDDLPRNPEVPPCRLSPSLVT